MACLMDYFNFRATTSRINSKRACDFLAQRLRELANYFESRSIELEQSRNNRFFVDDKAPALHVAEKMFQGWKSGGCPASICHNLAGRYYVNFDICMQLFNRKRSAYEREEIAKRNRRILKWDYHGVPQCEIVRRTGLSKGYVSKIINQKNTRQKSG